MSWVRSTGTSRSRPSTAIPTSRRRPRGTRPRRGRRAARGVERNERVTREAGQEAHGLAQGRHHRVADASGPVLHGCTRGHERCDVLADGAVGRCPVRWDPARQADVRPARLRRRCRGSRVHRGRARLRRARRRPRGRAGPRVAPSGVGTERDGSPAGYRRRRRRRDAARWRATSASPTAARGAAPPDPGERVGERVPPSMVTPAPVGRSVSHAGAGSGMKPNSSDHSPSTAASSATCCGARVDAPGPSAYAMTWGKRERLREPAAWLAATPEARSQRFATLSRA